MARRIDDFFSDTATGQRQTEFDQELARLIPRLHSFARRFCTSRADADDLVQEACVRALSKWTQFRPGTRFDSWMFRIVHTLAIDHARKKRHRSMAESGRASLLGQDEPTLSEEVEFRDSLRRTDIAMDKLSPSQRDILLMAALDELTYAEMAERMSVPTGTIMSRLSRARAALKAFSDDTAPASARDCGPRPAARGTQRHALDRAPHAACHAT